MPKRQCCEKPRRVVATTQWVIPTAILVLLPKCPMCLAAYIAMATGIGIPVAMATWLRAGLITVCVCSLLYLTWKKFAIIRQMSYCTPKK